MGEEGGGTDVDEGGEESDMREEGWMGMRGE